MPLTNVHALPAYVAKLSAYLSEQLQWVAAGQL